MYLVILLFAAVILGYWLARSKFHQKIDASITNFQTWWRKLIQRSKASVATENTATTKEKGE